MAAHPESQLLQLRYRHLQSTCRCIHVGKPREGPLAPCRSREKSAGKVLWMHADSTPPSLFPGLSVQYGVWWPAAPSSHVVPISTPNRAMCSSCQGLYEETNTVYVPIRPFGLFCGYSRLPTEYSIPFFTRVVFPFLKLFSRQSRLGINARLGDEIPNQFLSAPGGREEDVPTKRPEGRNRQETRPRAT